MHDINQIARQNAAAIRKDIPNLLAQGKHVVASYTGLHFVDAVALDTREQAAARRDELEAQGVVGSRHVVLSPGDALPN